MLITKPKIVIVDDDLDNLDVLCCELCDFYEIYPVSDGYFALQVVEDVQPDLIILDIMMPQVKGDPIVPIEQSYPKFGNIPVLFVAAVENVARKTQVLACGSMDCITKPYDIDEVLTIIGRYIPSAS